MIIQMLFFLIAFTLTVSQDTRDCIFMKCPAMNVTKFNVHFENAFQADQSRPVNHCI